MAALPEMVVFDLDFTLWDCGGLWIDCCEYPFEQHHNGRVFGARGSEFTLYPDVMDILEQLEGQGIRLSLASRTSAPKWARKLLDMFGILERFEHAQIYPGEKTRHFHKIRKASDVRYENMIFFDDEARNIHDVSALGVLSMHTRKGVNHGLLDRALKTYSDNYRNV